MSSTAAALMVDVGQNEEKYGCLLVLLCFVQISQRDRPKFVGTKDRQAAKFVGGLKIRDGASEGQTTHITHHPPPLSRYCIVRYHHLAIITKISP